MKRFWLLGIMLGLFTDSRAWEYRYHYFSVDEAKDMVYGLDGNIYACGMSDNTNGKRDIIVVSLTPNGEERWIYRYDGQAHDHDVAWALVYGDDGNIYVAGHNTQSGTTPDFTVISLTSIGSERWVYTYNGPGNDYDFAFDITYGNNKIYAIGRETVASGDQEATIICVDTSGAFQWKYDIPSSSIDPHQGGIVYGIDGNIYATCYSSTGMFVICLSETGSVNWIYSYTYTTPPPGLYCLDVPQFIIYGIDSNLYIGGYSYITDFWAIDSIFTAVLSLTPSGTLRWVYNSYDGPGTSGPDGAGDGVYHNGKFYFTTKSSINNQLKVIAVDSENGAEVWTYSHPYLSGFDYLYSIFLWGSFAFATGYQGGGDENDIVLFQINATDGTGNLVYTYDHGGSDVAYKGICSTTGHIYLAGYSHGPNTDEDFIVLGDVLVGIEESENPEFNAKPRSGENAKLRVFPNPFTTYTKVLGNTHNEIWVYDIQGRLMGKYKRDHIGEDLNPGVYFLKTEPGNIEETRVVKIR